MRDRPIVTCDSIASTMPEGPGFIPSWYEYDASSANRNDQDWFGARTGERKSPVSESTWCFALSPFCQVTVSPGFTITWSGLKPAAVMVTVLSALSRAMATVVAPAIASMAISRTTFFIVRMTP